VVDLTVAGRYRIMRDGSARVETEKKLRTAKLRPVED
jgi:hypothetical protein